MKNEMRTLRSIVPTVASSGSSIGGERVTRPDSANPVAARTGAAPGRPRARFVLWATALLLFVGTVPSAFGVSSASGRSGSMGPAVPIIVPPAFRLLGVTGGSGQNPFGLVELETQPAAEVLIGPAYAMVNAGLDLAPNGRLYGIGSSLREINPDTGSSQTVLTKIYGVPSGGTILWTDMAFHPDGTLYLVISRQVSTSSFQNEFYTVDLLTGVARELFRMPAAIQCIDFSPTGVLYGEGVGLCIIDLARKTFIPVSSAVQEGRFIQGLEWAPDGFFYGVDMRNRLLCQIDPATGQIVQEFGPYATDLANVAAVPRTDLAGAEGSETSYQIDVPAGRTKLEVVTSGGTGDVDLYVKKGSTPTTDNYDWRGYSSGNNELISISDPQAGTYHIMLKGYATYSGVTLKITCLP
jgi:hypothetical protein